MRWKQFLTPVESIDAVKAKEYINSNPQGSITLLDVRQPKEYSHGHISGSKLIPLPELKDRQDEIDPTKPVVVYCAIGGRSRVAAQYLAGNKFAKVFNLSGGYKSWEGNTAVGPEDQGLNLFSGKEEPEEVFKIAYSLEKGLREFYLLMIPLLVNEQCKELFEKLAEIEINHQNRIFSEYLRVTGKDTTRKEFEENVDTYGMEGGLSTKDYMDLYNPDINSPQEVVGLAMSIEAQALDLYQRAADNTSNADSGEILLQIAQEEQAHLKRLGELFEHI